MPPRFARPSLVWLSGLLLVCALPLVAVEPPPEPAYPDRAKLTDAQYNTARSEWYTAHAAWEANLTARQYLEQQEHKANAPRSADSIVQEKRLDRAQRLPLPADGYTWQADAAESKMDDLTRDALAKHKLAYGTSVKQSFEPYLGGPVFITSDSLLNAFHVLFEDSFRELELRRAARFQPDFENLLTTARKLACTEDILAPERVESALRHLDRVLGPALVLSGTPLEFFDAANRDDIRTQVERITAANSQELPAWLAPADPASLLAIDYTRCRPVGFYTQPDRLAAYFRAQRWLQLVPLRANREHEFDAMVLLACASRDCRFTYTPNPMRSLLGPNDDPSPLELSEAVDCVSPRMRNGYDCHRSGIQNLVVRTLIDRGYYRINTDLRAQRTFAQTFDQLTFRIVPQSALPDSVLFQQLLDGGQTPSGLAVAAQLGSSFAADKLDSAARTTIARLRDSDTPRPRHSRRTPSLYDDYLDTLRTLFLPPDPAAPAFMGSDAWAAKSCHTALAGWAQMRHTFTLQAKQSENYLGMVLVPPGFVEPNPEFYARLSALIHRCDQMLTEAEAYQPSAAVEIDTLRELIAYVRQERTKAVQATGPESADVKIDWDGTNDLSPERINSARMQRELDAIATEEKLLPADDRWTQSAFLIAIDKLIPRLEAQIARLEQGKELVQDSESNLRPRWQKLAQVVARIETLAHKQLRAHSWTEDESEFLKDYGETLAYIHGYYGNSWLTPRDDAPRWAEVSGLPERGTFLAAGVGRPRLIFVLYPWNGMEILCVGSVMQYYEYAAMERLTDEEWRVRLDSPAAPPLPAWFQPYAPVPAAPSSR